MVRRAYRQRSLVEVLLPDGDKLWDATLRQIDALLDDEVLVDRVADALARRHPQSRRRGRLGTPATVVLRMLVLKHLSDWSFDECEREVRGSLVYRAFCRIDGERVPDAKTLIRLARLLDAPVLKSSLVGPVHASRPSPSGPALLPSANRGEDGVCDPSWSLADPGHLSGFAAWIDLNDLRPHPHGHTVTSETP